MEVYNHWGPVNQDVTLPAERVSQLFGTLATYYQPPPVRVLPWRRGDGCNKLLHPFSAALS